MALRTPHQTKRYHLYWYEPGRPDIYLGAGDPPHTTKTREAARLTMAQLASTLPDAAEDPLSQRLELCVCQAPVIDGEDAQRAQDHAAFPGVCRMAYEMAGCNGSPKTKEEMDQALDELLGSEGYYVMDLELLDAWLTALSGEDMQTLVDGEETEIHEMSAGAPLSEKLRGMLQDVWDSVI